MSTLDVVFLVLSVVVCAGSLAAAVTLLLRHRAHPGRVRLFGRPIPRPTLLATAFFGYAVSFGLRVHGDLSDGSDHTGLATSTFVLGFALQLISMRDRARTPD
ncbi:hypothetical protein [Actinoplanes sp. NPDC051494]|uniref:hypothetical protein n=1 Tax=Actinoplanes sp. NPDC051494 TaxID=3363907 RepID=UPI0037968365